MLIFFFTFRQRHFDNNVFVECGGETYEPQHRVFVWKLWMILSYTLKIGKCFGEHISFTSVTFPSARPKTDTFSSVSKRALIFAAVHSWNLHISSEKFTDTAQRFAAFGGKMYTFRCLPRLTKTAKCTLCAIIFLPAVSLRFEQYKMA